MTNSLERRMWEHKNGFSPFTARYRINRLVYFEVFPHPMAAIIREKQLKRLSRAEKIVLIEKDNCRLDDLARDWF
jgi:putative endonuclease